MTNKNCKYCVKYGNKGIHAHLIKIKRKNQSSSERSWNVTDVLSKYSTRLDKSLICFSIVRMFLELEGFIFLFTK